MSGVVSERLVLVLTLCANTEVVGDTFLGVDSCRASWTTLAVEAVTPSVAECGFEIVSCSMLATVHVKMDDVRVWEAAGCAFDWVLREGVKDAVEADGFSATEVSGQDLSDCDGELHDSDFGLCLVFDFSCCRNRARSGSGTGSARFFFTSPPQSRGLTTLCEVSSLFNFSTLNAAVSLNIVATFSFKGVLEVLLSLHCVLFAEYNSAVFFMGESVFFESDTVSISSLVTSQTEMFSDVQSLAASSIFLSFEVRLSIFICWLLPLWIFSRDILFTLT